MKKSCHNCEDYIVCYGLDDIKEDKGENCPDWQLDFATYQNAFIQNEENNENPEY